jgi:predicted enzyme involved in methoxymalonyl-ACP biosynthesis
MSCRAFTRRIEHQCLNFLFTKFPIEEIVFDYLETPQNGPTREFFAELLGEPAQLGWKLTRDFFFDKRPLLFHTVREALHG